MKGLRQKNNELKRELDQLRSRSDMDESLRVVDRSYLIDEDFDEPDRENEQPDYDYPIDGNHLPRTPKYITRSSFNRDPLGEHPPAQIRQDDIDLDDDFRPLPKFKSDWTILPPKKRKAEVEDRQSNSNSKVACSNRGLPFPVKLDARGHAVGTVQLGSRSRMGK
jgi:hypothetical protein